MSPLVSLSVVVIHGEVVHSCCGRLASDMLSNYFPLHRFNTVCKLLYVPVQQSAELHLREFAPEVLTLCWALSSSAAW